MWTLSAVVWPWRFLGMMAHPLPTRCANGEYLSPEEQHTFFGSFNNADERFGNLKGAKRWKAILRVYAKSTNANVKVLRIDPETKKIKRLLFRSKFNNRRQDVVVRQSARAILSS